jgi:polyphosphate kinase
MQRNLSKRLELMFPVIDPKHRRRLIEALEIYFDDNVKAWRLSNDGTYEKVRQKGQRVRAQQTFYKQSVEAVRNAAHAIPQFRPLTRPES